LPGQPTATDARADLAAIHLGARRGSVTHAIAVMKAGAGAGGPGRRALSQGGDGDLAGDDHGCRQRDPEPERCREEDERGADQQLVGHRIEEGAKIRLHAPAAGKVAVSEVGRSHGGEERRGYAQPHRRWETEGGDERRERRHARNRQHIRQKPLPLGHRRRRAAWPGRLD